MTISAILANLLQRLALSTVPPDERECVAGDLNEELGASAGARARAAVGIAFSYQIEAYRNPNRVAAAVMVASIGTCLLWFIPIASSGMFVIPELLDHPHIRVAAFVWNASHITSALAAGLFIGRVTFGPTLDSSVRWHVGILLCFVVAAATAQAGDAIAGMAVMLLSVWTGDTTRHKARHAQTAV